MKTRHCLLLLPLVGCLTGCPQTPPPPPTGSPVAATPAVAPATPAPDELVGYQLKTLQMASGEPGWTFGAPEPERLLPGMVTLDETVIVQSGVAVYGVDGRTGKQLWRTPVEAHLSWLHSGAGAVYCASQGKLTSLDPKTGKQLWQVAVKGQAVAHTATEVGVVDESAVFTALDSKTGKTIWTSKPVELVAAASDKAFFLGASGEVRALNATDGKELWSHKGLDPQTTTVEAYGDGMVVVRTWKGLVGLDAGTGAKKWSTKEWGSPIVAGDSLVFSANPAGSNDGPFRAVCLGLKDGQERWSMPDHQRDLYVAKDRVLLGIGKTTEPVGSAGAAVVTLADGKVVWKTDRLPSPLLRGCTPASALFADYPSP